MKNDESAELMIDRYRKDLGCEDDGVCWCEVCCTIEKIVDDVIEEIKKKLDE